MLDYIRSVSVTTHQLSIYRSSIVLYFGGLQTQSREVFQNEHRLSTATMYDCSSEIVEVRAFADGL